MIVGFNYFKLLRRRDPSRPRFQPLDPGLVRHPRGGHGFVIQEAVVQGLVAHVAVVGVTLVFTSASLSCPPSTSSTPTVLSPFSLFSALLSFYFFFVA